MRGNLKIAEISNQMTLDKKEACPSKKIAIFVLLHKLQVQRLTKFRVPQKITVNDF